MTLEAMNFDPFVIPLLQGMVTNAVGKVYVNGLYTQDFPLERGVRQGNPMSPLLFDLSLQPLMCLLEDKCMKRILKGLRISNWETSFINFLLTMLASSSKIRNQNLRRLELQFKSFKIYLGHFQMLLRLSLCPW